MDKLKMSPPCKTLAETIVGLSSLLSEEYTFTSRGLYFSNSFSGDELFKPILILAQAYDYKFKYVLAALLILNLVIVGEEPTKLKLKILNLRRLYKKLVVAKNYDELVDYLDSLINLTNEILSDLTTASPVIYKRILNTIACEEE